jgi:hypothetical protein
MLCPSNSVEGDMASCGIGEFFLLFLKFHFHCIANRLTLRPVVNGHHVLPSELNDHCQTHDFQGPECLCSAQDPDEDAFMEACNFQVTSGHFSGEWVAACAQHKCKYWSKYSDSYFEGQ